MEIFAPSLTICFITILSLKLLQRQMSNNHLPPFYTRNPLSNKIINSTMIPISNIKSNLNPILPTRKDNNDDPRIREAQECTFQPKISSYSVRRSLELFLKDQQKYKLNKQQSIAHLRQQKHKTEEEDNTFIPQINHKSKYLRNSTGSHQNSVNCFERLAKEKTKDCHNNKQFSFSPEISNRSKSLKRKTDISELLYEDARRRKQKQQFIVQSQRNNTQRLSPLRGNPKTNRLVCKKILSELDQKINEEYISPLVAILTLQDLFNIDLNLPNPENKKIAKSILAYIAQKDGKGCQVVTTGRLRSFISAIISPEDQSYFNNEERMMIYHQFHHFYQERIKKNKIKISPPRISFAPKTLNSSNKLAQSFRMKTQEQVEQFIEKQKVNIKLEDGYFTIEDLLILNHMRKQQEIGKKRMEKQIQELKQCTFKPNIKPSISSLKKVEKSKKKQKIILKPKKDHDHSKKENRHSPISNLSALKQTKKKEKKVNEGEIQPKRQKTFADISIDTEKMLLRLSAGRQSRQISTHATQRGYPKNENWNNLRTKMLKRSIQSLQKIKVKNTKLI